MTYKRVLVTGGAGFIGSNLVKGLVKAGKSVTVLDNFSSGFRKNLDNILSVKVIEGDIRNQKDVENAMRGSEVIFHLAASVGNKRSIDNPISDAETNVIGTLQVLETARNQGIRKIITSSSAGIFGELKSIPIKEDHPIEPDSPYGCTKLCEEKLCLAYAKLYDIEAICLRYFNVYGPNQRYDLYGNVIPIFVFRMLQNKSLHIFGDGEQTRDFVHVNDVVQANLKAADSIGVSGAFNIASGNSVTINKLVEIILRNSGSNSRVEHLNERPGDVKHSLADISLASEKLHYNPVESLDKGIEDYIKWARTELE